MGEFLAASAFRDQPVDALAAAIRRCVGEHGVKCDEIREGNFTNDLWKRVGIAYPDDLDGYARILRLGADAMDRLPSSAL
jgi:hypothetical protein